jgi:hypothetical protein
VACSLTRHDAITLSVATFKYKAYKNNTHTDNEPEEVTRHALSATATQQDYVTGLADSTNAFRLELSTLQYKLDMIKHEIYPLATF